MDRAFFLKASSVAFFTGGQDIWSTPAPIPGGFIRVLISDDRRGEQPQIGDAKTFTFGARRWRGQPSIVSLPGGREGIVATLDVDAYLYGVVPIEASPGWPPGALQAQAIVARTFAFSRRSLSRPYDVLASESDQRYEGMDAEYLSTNAAVDATSGLALTYGGGPASVFYASCCGGHTADAAEIWGHNALPYLRGVNDPYCVAAPDYRWQRRLPLDRLNADLGARAPGDITGFAIGRADAGGRPLSVDVLGRTGRATFTTTEFRRLVGADTVRSTWIRSLALNVTQAPTEVIIEGSGRGHGVGFCQWGARYMSAVGAGARDILAFYFPGTALAHV